MEEGLWLSVALFFFRNKSVDRFKLRREKLTKRNLPASHVLKRGQNQKRGERKRARVERGGPRQRGFTLSEHQRPGGKPRPHTRGTTHNSRCDLAWTPRRLGGPGHSHWQDTGPRLQELRASPLWEALPKMLNPQGEASLAETHPVCWRVSNQLVVH